MLDGYRDRQKNESRRRQELGAWMLQWLLLPHAKEGSDPITIDALLGRKSRRRAARRFASPIAAFDAFFAAQSKQEVKADGK